MISPAPARIADVVSLPADLPAPTSLPPAAPPARILLTGATGFLGRHLLAGLLARTKAEVVCVVRGADDASARLRLEATLAKVDSPGSADVPPAPVVIDWRRVHVLAGQVDAAGFGWSGDVWQREAEVCDTVVHCAANVSFLPSFDRLRPVNVDSVTNLLRFAAVGRPKRLHLVSTYAVFNAAEYQGLTLAREIPVIGAGAGFRRGYPASKWAAERLGDLARERGWSVTIHRAGLLWGDLTTGRSKDDDILALNLDACRTLGVAQDIDFLMHVTPVDFAGAAIAAVAAQPALAHTHYHVVTERAVSWQALVDSLRRLGHPVRSVPPAAWFDALRQALPSHPEWTPLYWLLSQDPRRSFWSDANIFGLQYDASNLRSALAGTGIACPPLDDDALRVYLRKQ